MIKKSDFVKHLSQLNFRELYKLLKQKERWSNIPTDDFFFRFMVALKPLIELDVKELYHINGVCSGEGCGNFCERGIIFYRLVANKTNSVLDDRIVTPEFENKFCEETDDEDFFSIKLINLILEGPLDVLNDITFCSRMDYSSLLQTDTEFFSMDICHPHIYESETPERKLETIYPIQDNMLMDRFASRLRSLDSRILTKEFIDRMNKEREMYFYEDFYRSFSNRSLNGFLKFHERAMVIQKIYQSEERIIIMLKEYESLDKADECSWVEWLEHYYELVLDLIGEIRGLQVGPDNHFNESYTSLTKQNFWFMNNYSHFCFDMRPYRKIFDALNMFDELHQQCMKKYRMMSYQVYQNDFQGKMSFDSPRLHYLYYLANDGEGSDDFLLKE